jgi:hypothetical protein
VHKKPEDIWTRNKIDRKKGLSNIEISDVMKYEKIRVCLRKLREIFEVFLQLTCYQKKIRKDESGIINFQPSNCYGSHWVCYINKP